MATVRLWTDAEAEARPEVKAVFDDIRATRKSDFVNNFWRGLANQPEVLERTWNNLKAVMGAPGPLDPLTRELIYMAVSITNNCSYCIHSHTAAARAKGMTDARHRPARCIARGEALFRFQLDDVVTPPVGWRGLLRLRTRCWFRPNACAALSHGAPLHLT